MDGVFGHYIAPRDRFFEEGDSFFHVGFTHASAVNVAVSKVADSLGVAEVGGFLGVMKGELGIGLGVVL